MAVRPVALNAAIACLFIIGSSLFALWKRCLRTRMRSARLPTASLTSLAPSFSPQPHSPSSCRLQTPGDDRGRRRLAAHAGAGSIPGLAATRSQLAGGHYAVPRHDLFQHQHVRCALAQRHGQAARTARVWRGPTSSDRRCSLWRVSSPSSHWDVVFQLLARVPSLVDCLVEHDRIDPLQRPPPSLALCRPSSGELISNPVPVGGTFVRRRLLPSQSDLDVPGVEACGSSSDETTDPGRSTNSKEKPMTATPDQTPDAVLFGNRCRNPGSAEPRIPETGMTAAGCMRLVSRTSSRG